MLEDKDFFLDLFHQIIPCVDALFAQLQKRNIDAVHTHRVTKNFVEAGSRQRRNIPDLQRMSYELYDTVIANARDRFAFTGHLAAVVQFGSECFPEYTKDVPTQALRKTVDAYPLLFKPRNAQWHCLIYLIITIYGMCFLKLLNYVTTPMAIAASDGCFSTLKRIKTLLRNTTSQERLNALAILPIDA